MLTNKSIRDNIRNIISLNTSTFRHFNEIYIFGSILNDESSPNDIDILLIYNEFSDELIIFLKDAFTIFNHYCELFVDVTALSIEEENETHFLKRLGLKYLKIK